MKRALFSALVLAGLAAGGASCRVHRPGAAAHGAGYGAGLARRAITLGGEQATTGEPMTGFPDPARSPEPLPWSSPPDGAATAQPEEPAAAGSHQR